MYHAKASNFDILITVFIRFPFCGGLCGIIYWIRLTYLQHVTSETNELNEIPTQQLDEIRCGLCLAFTLFNFISILTINKVFKSQNWLDKTEENLAALQILALINVVLVSGFYTIQIISLNIEEINAAFHDRWTSATFKSNLKGMLAQKQVFVRYISHEIR